MSAKLPSSIIAVALGIVSGIGTGVFLAQRSLAPLLEKAAAASAAKVKKLPETMKQRGWDFWTIEIENLSNELKEERARLRKHAEALDQRAGRLAAEAKELDKVRADVERLRKEIADKIVEIGADEAKNLRTLSQTYATLTPKGAVAIFKEMDDATAVKILSLMKTEVVGAIFEEMSKSTTGDKPLAARAALLSEKIRMMKAAKSSAAN